MKRSFWAYAGSFGALWGALEATLGSFLHAMKVPFAGVLLASIGAALLIALRVLAPRPGILLATGAVCAAVKLSSPGTVLVGPAVGILTESLLVELATLLGANALTAVLSGALAASWAICQKVLTQILLYGAPIVDLYRELLSRGSKLLGLSVAGGVRLVVLFVASMAAFGALSALAGLRAGRRAHLLEVPAAQRGSEATTSERPSRAQGAAVLLFAVLELAALVVVDRRWHAFVLSTLLLVVTFAGRPLLRRSGSLRGWLVAFAILAALGALLDAQRVDGVLLAVTMIARAVGLVLACQAVLALLPPLTPSSSAFARAVTAALAALPHLTRTLGVALRTRRERGERSPVRLVLGLLDDAVALAAHAADAPF